MLELANVPPLSRVDHAGLRHPAVTMADASAWDAGLPGQRAEVSLFRVESRRVAAAQRLQAFPRGTETGANSCLRCDPDKKPSACSTMAMKITSSMLFPMMSFVR